MEWLGRASDAEQHTRNATTMQREKASVEACSGSSGQTRSNRVVMVVCSSYAAIIIAHRRYHGDPKGWEQAMGSERAHRKRASCASVGLSRARCSAFGGIAQAKSTRMRIESELSSKQITEDSVRGAWWGICRTQREVRGTHIIECDETLQP